MNSLQNKATTGKYQIDEETLKKYLIEKEQVDEKLWGKIQGKAKGKERDRKTAIILIFDNYRKVPNEADSLLIDFTSQDQPAFVRKILATQTLKNRTEIPASLYFDLINRLRQDPEPKIRAIVLPEFERWLMPLFQFPDIFKKIEEFKQKPIYREFEFNWLSFLTFDQMLVLLKMHKEGKDEEIRNMLMRVAKNRDFFKNFLKELLSISIFSPRLHVLEDSMEAHIDGKFTLSIPCLLAQIEGILWDIARKNGFAIGKTTIITNQGKREVKSAYTLVQDTGMYYLMADELAGFFLREVYTDTFRHAILHGRDPYYAKEEDSMKLIMLLRALAEIAKK